MDIKINAYIIQIGDSKPVNHNCCTATNKYLLSKLTSHRKW